MNLQNLSLWGLAKYLFPKIVEIALIKHDAHLRTLSLILQFL